MSESLSTRIRHCNSTPADESLADAAPVLLDACKRAVAWINAQGGNTSSDPADSLAPKFLHTAISAAEPR